MSRNIIRTKGREKSEMVVGDRILRYGAYHAMELFYELCRTSRLDLDIILTALRWALTCALETIYQELCAIELR